MSFICPHCEENVESGHSCKQAFEASPLAKVLRNKQAACDCNDKNGCEVTKVDGVHASWCEERSALLAEIEELKRERDAARDEALEAVNGPRCGDCEDTGMRENRVDGKYPCTCITETDYWKWNEAKIEAAESREKDLAAKLEIVSVAASALAFCAETSGGTAGRDEDLCRAIEGVKSILSLPIPGSAQHRDEEVRREAFRELSKLGELESKNGTFRIILDYDNYQDGARILDGDENVLAECYDIDQTPEDQFATAIESAIRAACEKGGENG